MKKIKPLMDALKKFRDHYDNSGSDYSVTDLIQPPRIIHLRKRYDKLIKAKPIDPTTEIDSFSGTGLHSIFEENLKDNVEYVLEHRMFIQALKRKVSGCPDIYHWPSNGLYDIKMTKAWKKIFSDLSEWEQQLNLYAYLFSLEGGVVKRLFIIAWWKNWNLKDMQGSPKYPRKPVEQIEMKLWSKSEQEDFLYTRLGSVMDDEKKSDKELTLCTPEDRWDRGEAWACYKLIKGKRMKKASRVLYSEVDMERWIKKMLPKGTPYEIEHRPALRVRCEDWCEVTDWCNQYMEYKKGGK